MDASRRRWVALRSAGGILVLWTIVALLDGVHSGISDAYRGHRVAWGPHLLDALLDAYSTGVFTPLFLVLVRRRPLERRGLLTSAAVYAAAIAIATAGKYAIYAPLFALEYPGHPPIGALLVYGVYGTILTFVFLVVVLHALRLYGAVRAQELAASRLQGQLAAAQLQALRAQMQPHFLFNTLNAISSLIHADPRAADDMVAGLAELLRFALRSDVAQTVSLHEELAVLRTYLAIMRRRFGPRLVIDEAIDPRTADERVPPFVLQVLAENAIRHGMDEGGTVHITIAADVLGDQLVLSVRDDGRGIAVTGIGRSGGIGLANTSAAPRTSLRRPGGLVGRAGNRRRDRRHGHAPARGGAGLMLRAVIADDESDARERIRRLLAAHADIDVVAECSDGPHTVEAIAGRRPDMLFLDIQMPRLDGFDVLQSIPENVRRPATVFVTAFDVHALRAFDVNAIDYLLKPFAQERFHLAVARARERIAGSLPPQRIEAMLAGLRRERAPDGRLAVHTGDGLEIVRFGEIEWLEADGNYVVLHLRGRALRVRDTLSHLAGLLLPLGFAQIHRSVIVNVDRIARLEPWRHGEVRVVLHGGARLTATRTFVHGVRARVGA